MATCEDWLPSNFTQWFQIWLESKEEPEWRGTLSFQKMLYQPNGWLIVQVPFVLRIVSVHYIKREKPRNDADCCVDPPPSPPPPDRRRCYVGQTAWSINLMGL
jgi:hypothetical protein